MVFSLAQIKNGGWERTVLCW